MIEVKDIIKTIADHWNKGEKDKAKRLFFISQWLFPEKTREFLQRKLKIEPVDKEQLSLLKEACDTMNGGKIICNGMEYYEHQNEEKGKAGEENPKGDTRLAV